MTKWESKNSNAKLVKLAWLSCVESVIVMIKIETNQPTKRNNAHLMLTTATGAALGAGVRYILPTKTEMRTFNDVADTFFSNTSVAARGANRSILKYAGIGAVVACGAHLISKLFDKKPQEQYEDSFEYSKLQTFIDAPDYACEILLYGE